MNTRLLSPLVIAACLAATAPRAEAPMIEAAVAEKVGMGWRFDVTLRHPDTGWDHYADGWEVVAPDGSVLGTRELMHPHVTEQPFTRSLTNVAVPDGVREVTVRARCSVHGWTSEGVAVTLDLDG